MTRSRLVGRCGGAHRWLAAVTVLTALTVAPSLASGKVDSHHPEDSQGLRAGSPIPFLGRDQASAQGDTIYTFSGARLYSCNLSGCQAIDTLDGAGFGINAVVAGDGWVYAADSNGMLWRCDPAGVNNCTQFDDAGDTNIILSLAFGGGRLYAGRVDGVIWNCDPNNANECETFDDAGGSSYAIQALVYSNDRLYAGRLDGVIWSCDPNNKNECSHLDSDGGNIESLAVSTDGSRLYAGRPDGIWSCGLGGNQCETIADTDPTYQDVYSLAYGTDASGNPRLYAGRADGVLWSCDPAGSQGNCSTLDAEPGESNSPIMSVQFANGQLYVGSCAATGAGGCGVQDVGVWICDPTTPNTCATNMPPTPSQQQPLSQQPTLRTSGSASTSVQGKTVVVDPGIKLSCPARGRPCSAAETATAIAQTAASRASTAGALIGSARFSAAAGSRRELRFELNHRGVRLLRKLGRLRVSVAVASWARHRKKLTTTKTITIKQPRPKRKRS
jgi:hypothetical protein